MRRRRWAATVRRSAAGWRRARRWAPPAPAAGIAVPHARLPGLAEPAGFFARLDRPIAFDAIDGRPVDLVFLLLSPEGADAVHLARLAAASRRLRDPAVLAAIRAARTPAALIAALGNLSPPEPPQR